MKPLLIPGASPRAGTARIHAAWSGKSPTEPQKRRQRLEQVKSDVSVHKPLDFAFKANGSWRLYKLLHGNFTFHVAAVREYEMLLHSISKAYFRIINFKDLVGKKKINQFLLCLTAHVAISQLLGTHTQACLLGGEGSGTSDTQTLRGPLCGGSVLHKTVRNPNLWQQPSRAACLSESEKEAKWNSSCISSW